MEVVVEDRQLSLAIGRRDRRAPGRQTQRLEDRHQERRDKKRKWRRNCGIEFGGAGEPRAARAPEITTRW